MDPKTSTTTAGSVTSDGSQIPVIDRIRDHFGKYVLAVQSSHLDLLSIWAAHTHLVHETYTTPRLLIDSPTHGSGKTTVLEHLNLLCFEPEPLSAVSSPAVLARLTADAPRTLLIDEADRTLRPDHPNGPEIKAVLNTGYKIGGSRTVNVSGPDGNWTPTRFSTFAPVAMAGNQPRLEEDVKSRTVTVLLIPDRQGTVLESNWRLIEHDTRQLGADLAQWADSVRKDVAESHPSLPEGVVGREREVWQPLKMVAVAAGGRWPETIDNLAREDHERRAQDIEDGLTYEPPAMVLLRDIRDVWPDQSTFLASAELVHLLIQRNPDWWGRNSPYGKELTQKRLARLLNDGFRVRVGRIHLNGETIRGFSRESFSTPWQHLPTEPA